MLNFNLNKLKLFLKSLAKLTLAKRYFLGLILFLTLLYPGQNSLQTLTIHSSTTITYQYPSLIFHPYPQTDGTSAPNLTARGILIQDLNSKTVIYQKNPDLLLLPASTTKIMTALVTLDLYNLDEVVTINNENKAIGSGMGLVAGEQISVRNLLYGLLIQSGNDSALALADHHPQGYEGFVRDMNSYAQRLNLTHTTYRNPSGVESYLHLTTARDLAVLATHALQNPEFAKIVDTVELAVTDISGQIVHNLKNTNQLLNNIADVHGIKTGWTEHAGECLVTYVNRQNHPVIIVLLASQARFAETRQLIDWVYQHHTWVKIN